jgi:hypothetical protein
MTDAQIKQLHIWQAESELRRLESHLNYTGDTLRRIATTEAIEHTKELLGAARMVRDWADKLARKE